MKVSDSIAEILFKRVRSELLAIYETVLDGNPRLGVASGLGESVSRFLKASPELQLRICKYPDIHIWLHAAARLVQNGTYCTLWQGYPLVLFRDLQRIVSPGTKPAMDDWIPADRWEGYSAYCRELGLRVIPDCVFSQVNDPRIKNGVLGADGLTTTVALGRRLGEAGVGDMVHVFCGREDDLVQRAYGAGWYPVIVDDRVIQKPRSDHVRFGEALGYPPCCVRAFMTSNRWYERSHYYEAYRATRGRPHVLCNGIPRGSPFAYTFHIPCSFRCRSTILISSRIRKGLKRLDPGYVARIDELLKLPYLVIYENLVYCLDGRVASSGEAEYDGVLFLGSNPADDLYGNLLASGNRVRLQENLIMVSQNSDFIDAIECVTTGKAPSIPFILQCSSR